MFTASEEMTPWIAQMIPEGKVAGDVYVHLASRWLAGKEREAKEREEASRAEQIKLMRRQAAAAERANTRATIAILIAVAAPGLPSADKDHEELWRLGFSVALVPKDGSAARRMR